MPSTEMARSVVSAAGAARPLRRVSSDDNQSVDESAAAIPVAEATAHAIPNPTARIPSRATVRVLNIDFPSPDAPIGCLIFAVSGHR